MMAANSDDEQLLAPVAPMSPTKQPRRASMDVDNNNEPRRGRSHSRSPRPSGSGSIDRRDDDRRNDNARPDDRARSGSARGGSQSHVRDQPEPSKVLGVFGMSLNTRQRDLEEIFGKFGALEKCVLVMDRFQERSRGFGFVTFERQEDASAAREAMNDAIVDDRRIRVDYSLTKRPHDRTPGYYAGKPTSELPDRRRRRSRSPPGRRYGGSGRDMSPRRDDRDRRRRSPSPYRRRDRSPSPRRDRRRSPSPYRERRRSPSPYRERRDRDRR